MTPNGDRTSNRTATGPSDRTPPGPGPDAFIPLADAAQRLGISYDAARRRIARGTLPAEKRGDRWFVPERATGLGPDDDPNARPDAGPDATGRGSDALVAVLQDEISFLRSELASRSEEIRRRDHLIAGFIERLPELPAGERSQTMPQDANPGTLRGDQDARASTSLIDRVRRLLGR